LLLSSTHDFGRSGGGAVKDCSRLTAHEVGRWGGRDWWCSHSAGWYRVWI